MDIRHLDRHEIRWIDQCAARLKAADAELRHAAAVRQAYELWCVLPSVPPVTAADAFLERETVVLPPPPLAFQPGANLLH